MEYFDIAIIGGGASGLIASIFAAKELNNGKIAIIERNERVGKKILSTGNGRCNFTNMNITKDRYHGNNPQFAMRVIEEFSLDKTLEFFNSIGILPRTEGKDKVFPNSLQAASVLDMLREKAKSSGVAEVCDFLCIDIKTNNGLFIVISDTNRTIKCKKVIVATGGMAAPNMGTDGKGYKLLEKFGHTKTKLSPSLVQLRCPPKSVSAMKGVKLDADIKVFSNDQFINSAYGELLFTEYGISGPAVFDISRSASVALNENKRVYVLIDLMPMFTEEELYNHLVLRNRNLTAEIFLNGMINKLIGKQMMKKAGIEKLNTSAENISDETLKKLAKILKNCRFEIIGTNPWNNSQVTAGGIQTFGFCNKTMESKLFDGIYGCGEILDVDGDCGGFNLQWAWSSGAVAGMSAAKSLKEI